MFKHRHELLWLLCVPINQLCALLSVLLDRFLELPTMQQGQRRQAASQAGVHCTAMTTERLLSRYRLNCIFSVLLRTPNPQLVVKSQLPLVCKQALSDGRRQSVIQPQVFAARKLRVNSSD